MNKRVSPKIATILLLAAIVMISGSIYSFRLLDHVIHSDLYQYGLTFDLEWATEYWTYSRLMISSLLTSVFMLFVSIMFLATRRKEWDAGPGSLIYVSLLAGFVTASLSLLLFTRLDKIVHGDLYRYGLSFQSEWALKYWNYSYLVLSLIVFTMVTMVISSILISSHSPTGVKIDKHKLISYSLLSIGSIALVFSILYEFSILALVGLGLTFWGALLLYIRPGKYVKEAVLTNTILPPMKNLEHILKEVGYKGKGIYLPPKYLGGSSKVYLNSEENKEMPSPEEILNRNDKMFLQTSALIAPPGSELLNLFEETLKINFTKVDLEFLRQRIPKLLIEELEIAEKVEIRNQKDRVHVDIQSTTYQDLWKKAEEFPKVWISLGCPLTSAIAGAIAKATGRPVSIEENRFNEKRQTIHVKYQLLQEE